MRGRGDPRRARPHVITSRTRWSTGGHGVEPGPGQRPGPASAFAEGLRAMPPRQDPDVVMVGEIRDTETARLAIEAALTGHLVLSTLHTNDRADLDPPPGRNGDRAVPGRLRRRLRDRAAPRAHALRRVQGGVSSSPPSGCARAGSRRTPTSTPSSRTAACAAARAATAAASASTRSCRSRATMRGLVLEARPADEIAAMAEQEGMTRACSTTASGRSRTA